MSVENAKAFLAKLGSDEGLRQQLMDADDDAARQQVAQAAGFGFTKAEFEEATGLDTAKLLSSDDLDSVVGGSAADDIAEVGIDVGVSAGTDVVCSAAAAAL